MKKYVLFYGALCLPFLFACNKKESALDKAWKECSEIEKEISAPSFPDKSFSIMDYGAKANDSLFLNTSALESAIAACANAGGGKVVIPEGTFYTGPVTLKSNINLHIEKGGILKFSTDTALYLPAVLTRWEGVDCYNFRPLIYAYEESNYSYYGRRHDRWTGFGCPLVVDERQ